ncbi:hypothetical protein [Paenibacillus qinlingensis]|uniref:Uncharacterized protein n=1 Tax=Paenibacillus qinlingensis TaxID=1837343 RepID=A0ABU1P1Q3_9BACL|nr:hypothetical protein [Paenibacillus qinlingensis]MDR6553027.1 hypothetical protein [Paenibacillus qinlingensis]
MIWWIGSNWVGEVVCLQFGRRGDSLIVMLLNVKIVAGLGVK